MHFSARLTVRSSSKAVQILADDDPSTGQELPMTMDWEAEQGRGQGVWVPVLNSSALPEKLLL